MLLALVLVLASSVCSMVSAQPTNVGRSAVVVTTAVSDFDGAALQTVSVVGDSSGGLVTTTPFNSAMPTEFTVFRSLLGNSHATGALTVQTVVGGLAADRELGVYLSDQSGGVLKWLLDGSAAGGSNAFSISGISDPGAIAIAYATDYLATGHGDLFVASSSSSTGLFLLEDVSSVLAATTLSAQEVTFDFTDASLLNTIVCMQYDSSTNTLFVLNSAPNTLVRYNFDYSLLVATQQELLFDQTCFDGSRGFSVDPQSNLWFTNTGSQYHQPSVSLSVFTDVYARPTVFVDSSNTGLTASSVPTSGAFVSDNFYFTNGLQVSKSAGYALIVNPSSLTANKIELQLSPITATIMPLVQYGLTVAVGDGDAGGTFATAASFSIHPFLKTFSFTYQQPTPGVTNITFTATGADQARYIMPPPVKVTTLGKIVALTPVVMLVSSTGVLKLVSDSVVPSGLTVTFSDGGGGGVFQPTSVTFAAGQSSSLQTNYTSVGTPKTITISFALSGPDTPYFLAIPSVSISNQGIAVLRNVPLTMSPGQTISGINVTLTPTPRSADGIVLIWASSDLNEPTAPDTFTPATTNQYRSTTPNGLLWSYTASNKPTLSSVVLTFGPSKLYFLQTVSVQIMSTATYMGQPASMAVGSTVTLTLLLQIAPVGLTLTLSDHGAGGVFSINPISMASATSRVFTYTASSTAVGLVSISTSLGGVDADKFFVPPTFSFPVKGTFAVTALPTVVDIRTLLSATLTVTPPVLAAGRLAANLDDGNKGGTSTAPAFGATQSTVTVDYHAPATPGTVSLNFTLTGPDAPFYNLVSPISLQVLGLVTLGGSNSSTPQGIVTYFASRTLLLPQAGTSTPVVLSFDPPVVAALGVQLNIAAAVLGPAGVASTNLVAGPALAVGVSQASTSFTMQASNAPASGVVSFSLSGAGASLYRTPASLNVEVQGVLHIAAVCAELLIGTPCSFVVAVSTAISSGLQIGVSSSGGGSFDAASYALAAGASSTTIVFTPPALPGTVSFAIALLGGADASRFQTPAAFTFNVLGYVTLSGAPAVLMADTTSVPISVTFSPPLIAAMTFAVSDGAGGVFTPNLTSLASGASGHSFVYHPSAASSGTVAQINFTLSGVAAPFYATPSPLSVRVAVRSSDSSLRSLAATLSGSSAVAGVLVPQFAASTTSYTLSTRDANFLALELVVNSTSVSALSWRQGMAAFTAITLPLPQPDNQAVISVASMLAVGDTTFTVRVAAQDTTITDYTLVVTRLASLATFVAVPAVVYADQSLPLQVALSGSVTPGQTLQALLIQLVVSGPSGVGHVAALSPSSLSFGASNLSLSFIFKAPALPTQLALQFAPMAGSAAGYFVGVASATINVLPRNLVLVTAPASSVTVLSSGVFSVTLDAAPASSGLDVHADVLDASGASLLVGGSSLSFDSTNWNLPVGVSFVAPATPQNVSLVLSLAGGDAVQFESPSVVVVPVALTSLVITPSGTSVESGANLTLSITLIGGGGLSEVVLEVACTTGSATTSLVFTPSSLTRTLFYMAPHSLLDVAAVLSFTIAGANAAQVAKPADLTLTVTALPVSVLSSTAVDSSTADNQSASSTAEVASSTSDDGTSSGESSSSTASSTASSSTAVSSSAFSSSAASSSSSLSSGGSMISSSSNEFLFSSSSTGAVAVDQSYGLVLSFTLLLSLDPFGYLSNATNFQLIFLDDMRHAIQLYASQAQPPVALYDLDKRVIVTELTSGYFAGTDTRPKNPTGIGCVTNDAQMVSSNGGGSPFVGWARITVVVLPLASNYAGPSAAADVNDLTRVEQMFAGLMSYSLSSTPSILDQPPCMSTYQNYLLSSLQNVTEVGLVPVHFCDEATTFTPRDGCDQLGPTVKASDTVLPLAPQTASKDNTWWILLVACVSASAFILCFGIMWRRRRARTRLLRAARAAPAAASGATKASSNSCSNVRARSRFALGASAGDVCATATRSPSPSARIDEFVAVSKPATPSLESCSSSNSCSSPSPTAASIAAASRYVVRAAANDEVVELTELSRAEAEGSLATALASGKQGASACSLATVPELSESMSPAPSPANAPAADRRPAHKAAVAAVINPHAWELIERDTIMSADQVVSVEEVAILPPQAASSPSPSRRPTPALSSGNASPKVSSFASSSVSDVPVLYAPVPVPGVPLGQEDELAGASVPTFEQLMMLMAAAAANSSTPAARADLISPSTPEMRALLSSPSSSPEMRTRGLLSGRLSHSRAGSMTSGLSRVSSFGLGFEPGFGTPPRSPRLLVGGGSCPGSGSASLMSTPSKTTRLLSGVNTPRHASSVLLEVGSAPVSPAVPVRRMKGLLVEGMGSPSHATIEAPMGALVTSPVRTPTHTPLSPTRPRHRTSPSTPAFTPPPDSRSGRPKPPVRRTLFKQLSQTLTT